MRKATFFNLVLSRYLKNLHQMPLESLGVIKIIAELRNIAKVAGQMPPLAPLWTYSLNIFKQRLDSSLGTARSISLFRLNKWVDSWLAKPSTIFMILYFYTKKDLNIYMLFARKTVTVFHNWHWYAHVKYNNVGIISATWSFELFPKLCTEKLGFSTRCNLSKNWNGILS